MVSVERCNSFWEKNKDRFLDEWAKFVSFKSISADPSYDSDCRKCAAWVIKELCKWGFRAELRETQGKPVVFAKRQGKPDKPKVVFYGHYDVQPVDPLDQWKSDPFKAEIHDGRLYARGAQDNKGQILYVLKAIEFLVTESLLDCSILAIIEGEEESSSKGLSLALSEWKDEMAGDILMVCDTGAMKAGVPCITMGLRGLVSVDIKLVGPKYDLHSGVHGGVARNPAVEMCRLISTLHNSDGGIAVKGYYDKVNVLSGKAKDFINSSVIDSGEYEKQIGVPPDGGEKGYSIVERKGIRPTIDVNGVHSGYGGPGTKTIIPAQAEAKITSRIVTAQEPEECLALIEAHLRTNTPPSLRLEVTDRVVGGRAVSLAPDSQLVKKAGQVLSEIGNGKIDYAWEGASIPIVAGLAHYSGAEPLLVGFGLDEDRIHAPNESFSIEQFRLGFVYAAMMLSSL